ncbi:hypothetical protein N7470_008542 [Penicillium chermesinum]|nr:hypothetical protein N7470_008542 [Penicillium chermesinum]
MKGLRVALAVALPCVDALAPRTKIADSYDFVIVGGGQAGLVLGARLSEDTNNTVLVLEAGDNGDAYRERIDTPADSYFDSLWTTPLNWDFYTVPQANAANREIRWPRGKTLGGSSAINGLYLTRPGQIEIDAWQSLLGDMDGADNWSWDSLYAAMKKSETFSAPSDKIAQEAQVTYNLSNLGTDGPIYVSYPGYTFPQVGDWSISLENIGIPISANMYDGEPWGAEVSMSTINPTNWTRSYSKTGYLDPLPDNGNYDVLADAMVMRLIFDSSSPSDNLTAESVEYTTDNGTTTLRVKVNKEVILAAGTIGSPAVLMHSGVGPKDVLSDAGVDLVSELPGVGQHLQDHYSATVMWATDVDTAGSIWYRNGSDKDNKLYLSYIDSAIAYYAPNTTYDDGVIAGYKAICNLTASTIFNSPTGQVELLFMNSDASGDIGITAALQHPYSHGRVYINSSDPMDYPVIDPNYLANPADFDILREGIKMARLLGGTAPLSNNLTKETTPGSDTQSDEDWNDFLSGFGGTEFHPSSTCAMLPREQGGVVDANLRVYGLANVRVADASVPPIALSTHLMASTYGLAELASSIIRDFYTGITMPESSATSTSSSAWATGTNKGNSKAAPSNSRQYLHVLAAFALGYGRFESACSTALVCLVQPRGWS